MVNIDREHPEYAAKKAMWKKYRDLYAGGEQIRENAFEYLVRRHKEPNDIYAERLSRVFYENYIGSIFPQELRNCLIHGDALQLCPLGHHFLHEGGPYECG